MIPLRVSTYVLAGELRSRLDGDRSLVTDRCSVATNYISTIGRTQGRNDLQLQDAEDQAGLCFLVPQHSSSQVSELSRPSGVRSIGHVWGCRAGHGRFPYENLSPHGFVRTSPVKKFAPNGYGLYDVVGNVWEWTSTPWTDSHVGGPAASIEPAHACCGPVSAMGEHDRYVMKGGSQLCAPSYCRRYRPAARQAHGPRDTTSHLGFRCVRAA